MSSSIVAYVDVDDTLVRSAGTVVIPIPTVIHRVRELHASGAILYCWSAGGADYARSVADRLGIAGCFTDFLPKPTLLIDDQVPDQWPFLRIIHPSQCSAAK